jgi:hypothetical protein
MNFIKILLITFVLIAFGSVSFFAVYFYQQYQKSLNKEALVSEEVKILKESVNKLMVLPDEDPIVATITDKTKLEQQAFFKQAENGDKVLIFQSSSKAVLYRPNQNKIVDITVLNAVNADAAIKNPTPSPTKTDDTSVVTVAIYNGSQTAGLTSKVEERLSAEFANLKVMSKVNAAKNDYKQTLVIDQSKKFTQIANEIAVKLNAKVVDIPEGEFPSSTDILIIASSEQ